MIGVVSAMVSEHGLRKWLHCIAIIIAIKAALMALKKAVCVEHDCPVIPH